MHVLDEQAERFLAALTGAREGFSRRVIVDEGIAPERLLWVSRYPGHVCDTLRLASYPDHPVACVWVESALGDLLLTLRWTWYGLPVVHVNGEVRCDYCTRLYRAHPIAHNHVDQDGVPYLHRGCDGALLKL